MLIPSPPGATSFTWQVDLSVLSELDIIRPEYSANTPGPTMREFLTMQPRINTQEKKNAVLSSLNSLG